MSERSAGTAYNPTALPGGGEVLSLLAFSSAQ